MTCSTKTPRASFISQWLGVADTAMVCGRMASHSSKRKGRLSMQEGRRKPYSASVALRRKSPRNAAELRDGDVALVDKDERVVRHVFEQSRRRLARLAAGEIARIVLDAAGAGGFHHFQVEHRALFEALRFQQAAGDVELVETAFELALDAGDGLDQRRARRDVMRVGVDLDEF